MGTSRFCTISLAVVAAATPFSGCDYATVPESVVAPSVVGVIEDVTHSDDTVGYHYTLEDGQTVAWLPDGAHLEGPVTPDEGDLLIYGEAALEDGATPWRAIAGAPPGQVDDTAREADSPCYRLNVDGEIRDGAMALTLGFSLPLADGFNAPFGDERYLNLPGGWFCLDADGRVTSATATPQRP